MTSFVSRPTAALAAAAVGLALSSAPALAVTELRVMVARYDERTAEMFDRIAAAFEAQHPDVDVQVEVEEWHDLYQRLTLDMSEGIAPDLAIVASRWLVDFVAEEAVAPLDGYLSPEFRDLFIPSLLQPATFDGQVWGLPVAASTRAMYYNRDLLTRAGHPEPPATWTELETTAGAVAALGEEIHGFGLQGGEIETDVYFYYALWSLGGALIAPDGRSGIDHDQAIAAAEMYQRFIDEGLTQPDVTATNRHDLEALFRAGRLGIVFSGPWLAGQLEREAPDLDYGLAPIPADAAATTYGVTDSIVMFASSQAKPQAGAFLEHLFQPEAALAFTGEAGYLPTTRLQTAGGETSPDLAFFASLLPDARFTPTIANWEEIADLTADALQRIYLGREAPADALGAAAEKIDAILAQ